MKSLIRSFVAILLLVAALARAQENAFTYQGRLDHSGVPANGEFDFTFVLCAEANGDNPIGTNSLAKVWVTNGLFTVGLDFGPAAFDGNPRWLEIRVGASASGELETLIPLQPLRPSPEALLARTVPTGAIGATHLAAQSVGAQQLANAAVDSAQLADGAVRSNHLAPGVVGTSHVANGAIHSNHLADGAVTVAKIADNSITGAKLAPGAVGSMHIADGAISTAQLAKPPRAGRTATTSLTPVLGPLRFPVNFSPPYGSSPVLMTRLDSPIPWLQTNNSVVVSNLSASGFQWSIAGLDMPSAAAVSTFSLTQSGDPYCFCRATNSTFGPQLSVAALGSGLGLSFQETQVVRTNYTHLGNYYSTFITQYVRQAFIFLTNGIGARPEAWVDTITPAGSNSSLAVVNGNPAISYQDTVTGRLRFVRAANPTGSAWGISINVSVLTGLGQYSSLAMINGAPAIAVYDSGNSALRFTRATTPNGTSWNVPVMLDSTGDVGRHPLLLTADGVPVIFYQHTSNGQLRFLRARDANGDTWDPPVVLDSGLGSGAFPAAAFINGKLALTYFETNQARLKYLQATDARGTAWQPAVILADHTAGPSFLFTQNGMPTVAYRQLYIFQGAFDKSGIGVVSAADVNGGVWHSPGMAYPETDSYSPYTALGGVVLGSKPVVPFLNYAGYGTIISAPNSYPDFTVSWIAVEP